MSEGFQGKEGQQVPEMTPAIVAGITDRYIELYEHITGEKFVKSDASAASATSLTPAALAARIESNVSAYLKTI